MSKQTLREQLTERVGKGHLSYSSIKYALGDMRKWEMYMKGEIKYKSDALIFGTLYDMLLFERDKAMATYLMINEGELAEGIDAKNPKLTKLYKGRLQEAKDNAEAKGLTIVSSEDWNQANEMIDRLDSCGLRQKRLTGEYQVEFNTEIDGVPVKGFLDCLGDNFITDSKSSRDLTKFKWDVGGFSYDIQAYIYTKVFNIKDYYWVVQEKNYPYYPAEVKCSEETLFAGEMKFHQAMENIKDYLDNGVDAVSHYGEFVV